MLFTNRNIRISWKAVLKFIFGLLFVFLLFLFLSKTISQNNVENTTEVLSELKALDAEALKDEKLRQEIQGLIIANQSSNNLLQIVSALAAPITAIIAIIGAVVTIYKQINENKRQNEKVIVQKEQERKLRREEQYKEIAQKLASENIAVKASAAASFAIFLSPEYEKFHLPLFNIIVASLKLEQDITIYEILKEPFQGFFREVMPTLKNEDPEYSVKLSRTTLSEINLCEQDLSYGDLAFCKSLNGDFTNSNLFRARGFQVNFSGSKFSGAQLGEVRFKKGLFEKAKFRKAILVSGRFEESNMKGAQFQQAKLQAAKLNEANLI